MQVFGRLAPGTDLDVVQQALAPVAAAIKAEAGQQAFNGRFEVIPIAASFIGDGKPLIVTLLVAVGFVLLIACANVSNLLLARSAYRVRETTVRSALGASSRPSGRAHAGRGLRDQRDRDGDRTAARVHRARRHAARGLATCWTTARPGGRFDIDYRVAAVAVGAAFLSTLLAGLPAAIRASRPSLDSLLRDGGRMGTGLAIGRIAWGLVVVEVALACLLLGVAALMTKSVLNATTSDVGVETDDLMTARVGLTAGTYLEEADQVRFWETLVARIQAQPGIQAAAVATSLPGHGAGDGPVSIEGRDYGDESKKPFVNMLTVSPSYFETFRIAPVAGRLFDSRDSADSMAVAVINEYMANSVFPDESPIGRRIKFDLKHGEKWATIVGVVPDVVFDEDGTIDEGIYFSVLQSPERFMSIAVRGEGDPRGLVGGVRTALAQTDPDLALYWLRTFDESRMVRPPGSVSSARCSPCSRASRLCWPPRACSACSPSTSANARARSACAALWARATGASCA